MGLLVGIGSGSLSQALHCHSYASMILTSDILAHQIFLQPVKSCEKLLILRTGIYQSSVISVVWSG